LSSKSVESVPSQTALFTALRRALAHRKYNNQGFGPDYLAEIFLPFYYRFFLRFKKIRERAIDQLAAAMPGMNEYIIARTAFFDGLFIDALRSQIPQIVLLGAGYDSRAYRFAQEIRDTRIFELDALPTQERKIMCLKAEKIRIPQEVRFTPANFASEGLGEVLENAGYNSQRRALFIWEGVSYYLERDAVRETLCLVGRSVHPESAIAFDYTIASSEAEAGGYFGAAVFLEAMKSYHTQEGLRFSLKEGEVAAFMADCGLRLVEHLDNEAIERKYLTDDRGSLLGRMTGLFRLACAEIAKG
jgi:methyltransferase (TIGR00027 family)